MTAPRRDMRPGTPFSDWVRHNPRLDSKEFGLCNQDVDWIWHQYRTIKDGVGSRTINHVLMIEEKSYSKCLEFSQRDTMYLVHQALSAADNKRFRTARGDRVLVRFWGYFLLRYSGTCLNCATEIWWNKRRVDTTTLESILRFDLDPVALKPYLDSSARRHHIKRLPLFGDENKPNS